MLEVELDIFSGNPNPQWILTEEEEQELVDRVKADPEQISPVITPGERFALGYRGFIVRFIKDSDGAWERAQLAAQATIPDEFRVGSRMARSDTSVARWLLETSARHHGVDDELLEVASRGAALVSPYREGPHLQNSSGAAQSELDRTQEAVEGGDLARAYAWDRCSANYYYANAHRFNEPQYLTKSNCYCFACNYLAGGRYAKPGRHGGHAATANTVSEIQKGLFWDGWVDNCQPGGLTIAAVVWPNQDYHFYRLVTRGPDWLWGHKRGATPACYDDDEGVDIKRFVILGMEFWRTPENCSRGGYTDFAGWYHQQNSTAFCK